MPVPGPAPPAGEQQSTHPVPLDISLVLSCAPSELTEGPLAAPEQPPPLHPAVEDHPAWPNAWRAAAISARKAALPPSTSDDAAAEAARPTVVVTMKPMEDRDRLTPEASVRFAEQRRKNLLLSRQQVRFILK